MPVWCWPCNGRLLTIPFSTAESDPMILFAFVIFISAFLLFQVQPLIARYILPWFGGTPGVWSVTLVFFQIVLLGGYAYAHLLHSRLKPARQLVVHLLVLGVAAAVLPIVPPESLKPDGTEDPTLRILALLSVTVGLPYFALSSTGPLLQAWFARRYTGRSPYALYALSNVGSLLALLSYPFLFESLWGRREQAVNWSWGFAVFAVGCAVTAVLGYLAARGPSAAPLPVAATEDSNGEGAATESPPAEELSRRQLALWILLPACATALLLAFTNHLTIDVASVPLLWVLPLSLYLLTFIITFAGERWYPRRVFLGLAILAAVGAVVFDHLHLGMSVPVAVGLLCTALFILCMACHGEVFRIRPRAEKLTTFYLCVSLGGALGGITVALVIPQLLPMFVEYPMGVLATLACVLLVHAKDPRSPLFAGRPRWAWILLVLMSAGVAGGFGYVTMNRLENTVHMKRNFYGVFMVKESPEDAKIIWNRKLVSGTTIHGMQIMEPDMQVMPTSYFGPDSGIGMVMESFPRSPRRMAVLGLGVGTLAAYGEPGDYIKFYEINPVCVDIANNYFFYLQNSLAECEIALGDARLVMEREEPQNYDIIVMDAFSSDSVPIHLLTAEAFQIYLRHLKPDGVIAVNISNRYLDLRPVIKHSAVSIDFRSTGWMSPQSKNGLASGAVWIFATRDSAFMQSFGKHVEKRRLEFKREPEGDDGHWPKYFGQPLELGQLREIKPWTDDYSNIFQIIK